MVQRSSTCILSTRAKNILEDGEMQQIIDSLSARLSLKTGIYCENGPTPQMGDLFSASSPISFMMGGMLQRMADTAAQIDKSDILSSSNITTLIWMAIPRHLLDRLDKTEFRRNQGFDNTGVFVIHWQRAGGYYLGMSICRNQSLHLSHKFQIRERLNWLQMAKSRSKPVRGSIILQGTRSCSKMDGAFLQK